ncbi:MAG: VCBS repeat-containing protein, partial [Candidatus Thorarchaeota archaeon]
MDHDSFLCVTYPYIHMVEVDKRFQDDGYWGYEAYDSWTNWGIFETWSMCLEYGDVDKDGKPEVLVGSFDNNLIAFEQVTKNIYRRSWRSQDFFLQNWLTGTNSPFLVNIPDIVIGDQDQDEREEIIVCAGVNVYVFEVVDNDMYELVWVSDYLNDHGTPPTQKVPYAITVDEDLDGDNRSEIIVGAQDYMFIFENTGDNNYTLVSYYELELLELNAPFIRDIEIGDINRDGLKDIVIVGTESKIDGGDIYSMGWVRYFTNELDADFAPIDNNYTQFDVDSTLEEAYCLDIADLDSDGWLEVFIGAGDGVNIFECDDAGTYGFAKLLPTTKTVFAVSTGNTDGDSWNEVVVGTGKNLTVFEQNATYDQGLHMYDAVWSSGELHELVTDIQLGDSNVNNRTEIIATALKGYLYAFEWISNSSGIAITPTFCMASTVSDTLTGSITSNPSVIALFDDVRRDFERILLGDREGLVPKEE